MEKRGGRKRMLPPEEWLEVTKELEALECRKAPPVFWKLKYVLCFALCVCFVPMCVCVRVFVA